MVLGSEVRCTLHRNDLLFVGATLVLSGSGGRECVSCPTSINIISQNGPHIQRFPAPSCARDVARQMRLVREEPSASYTVSMNGRMSALPARRSPIS